jgi:hypothetical protein
VAKMKARVKESLCLGAIDFQRENTKEKEYFLTFMLCAMFYNLKEPNIEYFYIGGNFLEAVKFQRKNVKNYNIKTRGVKMKAKIKFGRVNSYRVIFFIRKYKNTKNHFLDITDRKDSSTIFCFKAKGVEFNKEYVEIFENEKYGTTFVRYFRSNLSGGGK